MSQSGSSGTASSSGRHSKHTKLNIQSNLRDSPCRRDAFNDISELLDLLHINKVPGPRLIRFNKDSEEFFEHVGQGAQSTVQATSKDFSNQLLHLANNPVHDFAGSSFRTRVSSSADAWRGCVVKQLRNDRRGQSHLSQVEYGLRELKILCKTRFKSSNVIRLEGWGLCLDALEKRAFSPELLATPRLPLLILDRAKFDLSLFIKDHLRSFKRLIFMIVDFLPSILDAA
ncbi:hypothetical protein N7493_009220 [Penicillium malachiteum]|uniref:Uncharacterized protein n=1 Tax=Penicillium malachiteum TaxID=1324776 RepID=A0AAD6HG84_9EURO|nr:hypothetical protein N7493_009220 [Penicillium malachiteum]